MKTLRVNERPNAGGSEADRRATFAQIRAARERGDTATAERLMAEARAKMQADRDTHVAALRNILTADQRTQFDKNLAELNQRRGPRMNGRDRTSRNQGRE